jgi:hypothetical protein
VFQRTTPNTNTVLVQEVVRDCAVAGGVKADAVLAIVRASIVGYCAFAGGGEGDAMVSIIRTGIVPYRIGIGVSQAHAVIIVVQTGVVRDCTFAGVVEVNAIKIIGANIVFENVVISVQLNAIIVIITCVVDDSVMI